MIEISENTIVRKGILFLYSSFHLIHKVGNFTLLKFQHNLYTFKSYQLKLYVQWQIEIYIKIDLTDNYIQFMFIEVYTQTPTMQLGSRLSLCK